MAGIPASYGATLARVRAVRRGKDGVLLEGVHALKHAIRFGADIEVAATPDRAGLLALLADLAPDVSLPDRLLEVDRGTWRALTDGRELPSPALAVAARADVAPAEVLAAPGRIVVLEQPRHLGNLGAAVRVAAAAGAGGVVVVGAADPWHPTAVRAAAGLQFALPVARTEQLPSSGERPVIALDTDPHGPTDDAVDLDTSAAVALFGTERAGLSAALRARATHTAAIPMRAGVSSLNLATAVAATLYGGVLDTARLRSRPGAQARA